MTEPDPIIQPGPDGLVRVAGLGVPRTFAPRVIAAIRGVYPELTQGRDDDAAVRAWLKYMVRAVVSQHEERRALAPVDDALEATRAEYRAKADAARARAERDADTIVEQPPALPVSPA